MTAGHQAFDHRPTYRVWHVEVGNRQALAVERIEAIEGTENALRELTALGRVRVDVGESRKLGWKRGLPVHRDGVARVRRAGRPKNDAAGSHERGGGQAGC